MFFKKQHTVLLILAITLFHAAGELSAQHVEFVSSNLPIVILDTQGTPIPDEPKIRAHMGIVKNHGVNCTHHPCNHFNGSIDIELRGNSSQTYPQKQYLLETLDAEGEEDNVPLMDFPKEHDWILFAPYVDKSLMRDVLVYETARQMGWYASRTHYCELVLNNEYQGVYVLLEQIKRDKDRVSISKLDASITEGDARTGGYIVAIDHNGREGDIGFPGAEDSIGYFVYWHVYPKSKNLNIHQRWYMQDLIRDYENVMRSDEFADPGTGYPAYLNIESFVDYILINEWCNNVDGFVASLYLHKDRNSIDHRIVAGPVWDFNLAFGNANYNDAMLTTGWRSHYGRVPFWWHRLLEDPAFVARLSARWRELRTGVLATAKLEHRIDSLVVLLNEAQQRHFTRWELLGTSVWPNYFVGDTWAEEISYLKQWIHDRSNWMDANIETLAWVDTTTTAVEPARAQPDAFTVQCFPQPAREDVTLAVNSDRNRALVLCVFNMQGALVRRRDLQVMQAERTMVRIDMRKLPAGLYTVAVTDERGHRTMTVFHHLR
ncbi:CotH kinase family protein [bacterium]|nr:CotH kinase family protein [bacterium]